MTFANMIKNSLLAEILHYRRSVALQYGQPSMTYDIASVVTLPGNGFCDEVITGNITGNYYLGSF